MTSALFTQHTTFLWLRTRATTSLSREEPEHAVGFALAVCPALGRHRAGWIREVGPAARLVEDDLSPAGARRVAGHAALCPSRWATRRGCAWLGGRGCRRGIRLARCRSMNRSCCRLLFNPVRGQGAL